jgi:site-specific DNA-methyltransferase (adenine-specific)
MKLLLGDCLEKLKELDDNSVDSIVTDPPYGLSFMGKDWDKVKATQETKSQVVKGLGAGMKMTTLADNIEFEKWVTEWSMECYRVLKPGGYMLAFGGSRMYHRLASGVENAGFEIRDQMMWVYGSGFPKSMDISKQIDKAAGKLEERKVIGQREDILKKQAKDLREGKRKIKETFNGDSSGNGFVSVSADITEPVTNEAKQWQGWGTSLKPAHEPIVMGRKPISEKTVAENVLEWGTGAINIDGCRVAFQDDNDIKKMERPNCIGKNYGTVKGGETFLSGDIESISNLKAHEQGRFPANIIFDEEAGKILDEQSGISKQSGKLYEGKDSKTSFGQIKSSAVNTNYGDIGGASRFFYCPKTSKSDRSEGNIHPTVKPTDLMAYLIRLVTPKGGIVLDPFMGSGSTGKAAVREGMNFIGIERETEYFEIAKSRIEYEINKPTPKSTKTKKVEVEKKVEEKVNQFFG